MSAPKKFCFKCSKQVPDDAKVCGNCGSRSFHFKYPDDKQSESSQSKGDFTWSKTDGHHTCISCGKYCLIENRRCSSCGAYQVDKTDMKGKEDDVSLLMLYNIMQEQFNQTKKQRIISGILTAAAVIYVISVIVFAILFIWLFFSSHHSFSIY